MARPEVIVGEPFIPCHMQGAGHLPPALCRYELPGQRGTTANGALTAHAGRNPRPGPDPGERGRGRGCPPCRSRAKVPLATDLRICPASSARGRLEIAAMLPTAARRKP